MNVVALIEFLQTSPLPWLIFTIGAYKIGRIVYEKSGRHSLLQPILIAYVIILPILIFSEVSYEHFFESTQLLHFFLGATTVGLALPLYNNLQHIYAYFIPIVLTLLIGGFVTMASAVFILYLFDTSLVTMLSMSTRSVTAAITIITAEQIGANASLAVGFVLITALLGPLFANSVIKILNIKSDVAKGFALGLVSHAIGIAKSTEISQKATAFAALAMSLYGVIVAFLLPIIVVYFGIN